MFPTQPLHQQYIKVFQLPFRVEGVRVDSPELGIFHAMLELLIDLFHVDDKSLKKEVKNQDLFNFYQWDAHCDETSSFENFPRIEKIERIYLVLDLLIRVFEEDLAMFLTNYSGRLRSSLDNHERRPIICSVLWNNLFTVVNSTIKTIITVFVNTTVLGYPKDKIKVMSRLLNVISHVLNLYEYPDEVNEYPIYKTISENLVREIKKIVDAASCHDADLIADVLENIRSPLLQILLAHATLQNIQKDTKPISLEVLYNMIRTKEFAKYCVKTPRKSKNSEEKYPTFHRSGNTECAEISQEAFLKLIRIYFEAINSFYCIKACVDELKKVSHDEEMKVVELPNTFDFSNFKTKIAEINLDEKIQLRQVDTKGLKQISIKFTKESLCFYRKEMKYSLLLVKLVKENSQEKKSATFDELLKIVNKFEA